MVCASRIESRNLDDTDLKFGSRLPAALDPNKRTFNMALVGSNVAMVGGLAKVTGAVNGTLPTSCSRACYTQKRSAVPIRTPTYSGLTPQEPKSFAV